MFCNRKCTQSHSGRVPLQCQVVRYNHNSLKSNAATSPKRQTALKPQDFSRLHRVSNYPNGVGNRNDDVPQLTLSFAIQYTCSRTSQFNVISQAQEVEFPMINFTVE